MNRLKKVKQIKIERLSDGLNSKKEEKKIKEKEDKSINNDELMNYMMNIFSNELYDEDIEEYFSVDIDIKVDEENEKEVKIKKHITKIEELYEKTIKIKEKHILLEASDFPSQVNEKRISTFMNDFKNKLKINDDDKITKETSSEIKNKAYIVESDVSTDQVNTLNSIKTNQKDIDRSSIEALLENEEIEFEDDLYKGIKYNEEEVLERVLVISHSGFILEVLNVINKIRGLSPLEIDIINNCSITILRIFCSICNGRCIGNGDGCEVEYNLIMINNNSHLEFLA